MQPPDRGVGDPELDDLDVAAVAEERPLVGRRAGGHGQRVAGPVEHGEAGVEGAGGGADDLGQAGARTRPPR